MSFICDLADSLLICLQFYQLGVSISLFGECILITHEICWKLHNLAMLAGHNETFSSSYHKPAQGFHVPQLFDQPTYSIVCFFFTLALGLHGKIIHQLK